MAGVGGAWPPKSNQSQHDPILFDAPKAPSSGTKNGAFGDCRSGAPNPGPCDYGRGWGTFARFLVGLWRKKKKIQRILRPSQAEYC